MKKVVLRRRESSDHGTFGKLFVDDKVFFTGELPWRENLANISCIPAGTYKCIWSSSPRFRRKLYLLTPTDPRTGVRMHSANLCGDRALGYFAQLNGCIALGKKLGLMDGQKAVLLSMPAMREFEKHMNFESFELEVIDGY